MNSGTSSSRLELYGERILLTRGSPAGSRKLDSGSREVAVPITASRRRRRGSP
jgi:hypothetical protein